MSVIRTALHSAVDTIELVNELGYRVNVATARQAHKLIDRFYINWREFNKGITEEIGKSLDELYKGITEEVLKNTEGVIEEVLRDVGLQARPSAGVGLNTRVYEAG